MTNMNEMKNAQIFIIKNFAIHMKFHSNTTHLSTIFYQVQCAPEFHNDFLAKKLFTFFKNNFSKIDHSKFIHLKSHLKPFLSYLPCIVRRQEIFQHHIQCKKVRTILDKIWYDRLALNCPRHVFKALMFKIQIRECISFFSLSKLNPF